MNQYETVFILTPVLSDVQMKEAVEKFKSILTAEGAEIVNEELGTEEAGISYPEEVNRFLSAD